MARLTSYMNLKKIAPLLALVFVPVVAYMVIEKGVDEEPTATIVPSTGEEVRVATVAVTDDTESEPDGKGEFIEMIRVFAPTSNQTITSPVTIRGEARGGWYFEADFPVKIVDANGTVLAQAAMQADGDWMTTNFVPFEQSISFTVPATDTGFIIFEKDNPSGLPENAGEYKLPIRFQR